MSERTWHLVFRAGGRLCALPLASVVETTPPLPLNVVVADPPKGVLGIAIWRGAPVPVVDAGAICGERHDPPQRLVIVRAGDRRIALAVEGVSGVRLLPAEALTPLPPLLADAEDGGVSRLGMLDAELLVVLQAARVLPEHSFDAVMANAS